MSLSRGFQHTLFYLMVLTLVCLSGACSRGPKYVHENSLRGVKAVEMEKYALNCYEQGMEYLEDNEYASARESFSAASAAAVSPELKQTAINALKRVEEITDVAGLNGYARKCYKDGLYYLKCNRHELARDKFSLAASSAVSPELRAMAEQGMEHVDKLMLEGR